VDEILDRNTDGTDLFSPLAHSLKQRPAPLDFFWGHGRKVRKFDFADRGRSGPGTVVRMMGRAVSKSSNHYRRLMTEREFADFNTMIDSHGERIEATWRRQDPV
jgi:hypothetical protein